MQKQIFKNIKDCIINAFLKWLLLRIKHSKLLI